MRMIPATKACELLGLSESDYDCVIKHYNGGATDLNGIAMVDYDKFKVVLWGIRHPIKGIIIKAIDVAEKVKMYINRRSAA